MSPARWWQGTGTLWLGSEFHCLPLQGTGGRIGKGQLLRSQADRAGYENPGEDCGRPHQTVGVNRRFPVWLRPRQRQYRCNLCCQAAARIVSTCQQETLHGFRRPGEGVWSSTLEGHLVGAEKSWCGGVDCATGAGDVCKCAERVRVGEGYSEEFEVKLGVHQGSVLCSSLLCLKPYHESSALGSPGKTFMLMILLSSLNRLRHVSGGSWHGKKQWRRKDWE